MKRPARCWRFTLATALAAMTLCTVVVKLGGNIYEMQRRKAHVYELLRAFNKGDDRVRERVLSRLAELRANAGCAVPSLIELLASYDAYELYESTDTCRMHCLQTGSEVLVSGIVRALGRIGAPALRPVTAGLSDTRVNVRCGCALALKEMGIEANGSSPELVDRLTNDSSQRVRTVATYALGHIGAHDDATLRAVVAGLKDSHVTVRHEAADTLGRIGPHARATIPELRHVLLQTEDEEFRVRIVSALGKIGSGDAVPDLIRVVEQREPLSWPRQATRGAAVWALGSIGRDAHVALPILLDVLRRRNADVSLFVGAVLSIERIAPGERRHIRLLFDATQDPHPAVRDWAMRALEELLTARQSGTTATSLGEALRSTYSLDAPDKELEDLRPAATNAAVETRKASVPRIREFVFDAQGRIGSFARANDGSTSFVLLSQKGELLREVPLDVGRERVDDWNCHAWLEDERFVVVFCKPGIERWPPEASWFDLTTGGLTQIPKFQSLPVVRRVVGFPDGGFAILAHQLVGYFAATLTKYSRSGEVQWTLDADLRRLPGTLYGPDDVAVNTSGEIIVLDEVGEYLQIFDGQGRFLREVCFDKIWSHPPAYPSRITADIDGGVVIHDAGGSPQLVRVERNGMLRVEFDVRFPDGRLVGRLSDMKVAPDGRLWVCDGSALLRVNDAGVVDAVVGEILPETKVPRKEQENKPVLVEAGTKPQADEETNSPDKDRQGQGTKPASVEPGTKPQAHEEADRASGK